MKKAIFLSQHSECGTKIDSPKPSSRYLPQWYKNAHKYLNSEGHPGSLEDVKKSKAFPTFKNCVPFFDGMTSGYMFETLCDLKVSMANGVPQIEAEKGYEDFVGYRGPTNEFYDSDIYAREHFHWVPPWALKLPDGYSALYLNPINRFDLPFNTISGIIDNDKVHMTGQYPFMIKKGFEGIIPKGTPYVQIIPFKRDTWESEAEILNPTDLIINRFKTPFKYRKRKANYYRNYNWERKHYG